MKKILVYKIDVVKKDIYPISIAVRNLEDIYHALDCELISSAYFPGIGTDALYIDDEGLFRDRDELLGAFIHVSGTVQPYMGHGLIVGIDLEGDNADAATTLEQLRKTVVFLNAKGTLHFFDKLNNIAPTITSWD